MLGFFQARQSTGRRRRSCACRRPPGPPWPSCRFWPGWPPPRP
ncbi:hypothetical protein HMPREF0731_3539, partial [Pseudoroseomonas cervicalis ATCC 49957]